ncbi:MAG: MOSC domain-containing protein [Lachnospiraceae bacterium]|nr:MOSC domain-containing protein [Lachnospiraceae bacterium]
MGKIEAVCISENKGTVKKDIGSCKLIENYGLEGDAHAGSGRQVSLLSAEQVEAFRARSKGAVELPPGVFGENLLVSGYDLKSYPIGTRFLIGSGEGEVLLELTQIGKQCHTGCEIMKTTGECIMPHEGVFAKVIKGGTVSVGDEIKIPFRAAVITASDRSFRGEREDKSGPKMAELLVQAGYQISSMTLLPDDEDGLYEAMIKIVDEEKPDVIFTTGGTGFSERDRMPEATKRVIERETPGISEGIRAYSMKITSKAMLSRAASGIRKKTLIVNLPGSPKAVAECLEFLLPPLEHGLMILRGEGDD